MKSRKQVAREKTFMPRRLLPTNRCGNGGLAWNSGDGEGFDIAGTSPQSKYSVREARAQHENAEDQAHGDSRTVGGADPSLGLQECESICQVSDEMRKHLNEDCCARALQKLCTLDLRESASSGSQCRTTLKLLPLLLSWLKFEW